MTPDGPLRPVWLSSGLTLRYASHGDARGTAVVLLHPWVESARCFDRLLPLLPPTIHVLTVDQRGHGESDKPVDGYSLEELADDVDAFMAAVGVDTAVLLGSSSGGYVAQEVAVRHPRRVCGLVLVGSPRSLRGRPSFADEVERLTDPVDRAWVMQSLSWYPLSHDVPDWYLDDRVTDGVRVPAHVWSAALAGLYDAVPPTDAATITAPTLVIGGGRDALLGPDEQRRLAAAIPGSRLVIYDDTGHLVLWERPDRVAAALTDFVRDLPGPRTAG